MIFFFPVNEQMDKHQGLHLMRYGSKSKGYQRVKLFIFPPFNLEKEVLQSNLRTVRLLQRERGGVFFFFFLPFQQKKCKKRKREGEEGTRSDLTFVNIQLPKRSSCLHIPRLPLTEVFKKNHLLAETSIIQFLATSLV